jgi:hypothetical protein
MVEQGPTRRFGSTMISSGIPSSINIVIDTPQDRWLRLQAFRPTPLIKEFKEDVEIRR